MGFKDAKQQIIDCLNKGQFSHEQRENIDIKNLLSTGDVTPEEVAAILGRSRGNNYSSSPYDYDSSIDVHIVKTTHQDINWYIKWYFLEPDAVFISVHN